MVCTVTSGSALGRLTRTLPCTLILTLTNNNHVGIKFPKLGNIYKENFNKVVPGANANVRHKFLNNCAMGAAAELINDDPLGQLHVFQPSCIGQIVAVPPRPDPLALSRVPQRDPSRCPQLSPPSPKPKADRLANRGEWR